MYQWGFSNKLEITRWMNKIDFEEWKNNRDPYEEPSIPYIQPSPDKPGKLLWFSGKHVYFSISALSTYINLY